MRACSPRVATSLPSPLLPASQTYRKKENKLSLIERKQTTKPLRRRVVSGHLTESGQFCAKCKFQFFSTSPLKMRACGTGENLLNMTSVECEFLQTTVLDCTQPFFASGVTFVSFGVRHFATQNRVIS